MKSKLIALAILLVAARAGADSRNLPGDFTLAEVTYGGAGGGLSREERTALRHYPVIMVPGIGRDHTDWTGRSIPGSASGKGSSVYDRLVRAGFHPVELWMIDFSRPGEQMTSIEEATDDLKFFIYAVMRYTGADRVQILAHDTGCLLSRLTILKYNIAHWVESEVYVAGPFHGVSVPPDPRLALAGYPNAWGLAPGSDLLKEILSPGESPVFTAPFSADRFQLNTLTIRDGTGCGDSVFALNPDSPCLAGARNVMLPGLDHEQLRCSSAAAAVFIPFLARRARPYDPAEDRDADGFMSALRGGPDFDDSDPAVYPGAPEIPGDGIDQDCNGCDLAAVRGRDGEIRLPPRGVRRPVRR